MANQGGVKIMRQVGKTRVKFYLAAEKQDSIFLFPGNFQPVGSLFRRAVFHLKIAFFAPL
ncbi:MAG: hypothetical protein AAB316_10210 [Bacteroidota bacterium]